MVRRNPDNESSPAARRLWDRSFFTHLLLAFWVGGCHEGPSVQATNDTALQLRSLLSIGTQTGDGPAAFGRIGDLEVGKDRSVYVLDRLNRVVQVFDERGKHVRSIGREGSGPGELANPVALAWDTMGRLWVVDPGNSRYTVFSADGELITTYLGTEVGALAAWPGGFSPDGRLYDASIEFTPAGPVEGLVEYEVLATEIRELRRIELPQLDWITFKVPQGSMFMVTPVPFASQPIWRIGPDGHLWYARTGEPWVYRRSLDDGTEQRFGRAFEAAPVSNEEREKAIKGLADFVKRGHVDLSLIPRTKPHLRGFFFDDEQNLWIMRSIERGSSGDAWLMDVWDQEGNLLGTVNGKLESAPRPKVRDGLVAGIARNDLGIESVSLYQLLR